MKNITRTLPCKLTNNELLEKSSLAAALYKEKKEKETDLKSVSSTFKEDIKELTGEIAQIHRHIYNKEEPRPVECGWFINRKEKIKLLKRLDTMEVVETQGLSDTELQENFFEDKENYLEEDTNSLQVPSN